MFRLLARCFLLAGLSFAAVPIPVSIARDSNAPKSAPDVVPPLTADNGIDLPARDPVAFLEACRRRYQQEVRGYTVTLVKQERVNGQLNPREEVLVSVREEPFAVHMHWKSGARKVFGSAIESTLFVAGENGGRMKVWRPNALLKIVDASPSDGPARSASRYAISESGLFHTIDRTSRAWRAARDDGRLFVEYLGLKPIAELNGRKCHVLKRTCDPPENDAFLNGEKPGDNPAHAFRILTVFVDAETGIQIGSELLRADGELVGNYYFRNLVVNPTFPPDRFTVAGFGK